MPTYILRLTTKTSFKERDLSNIIYKKTTCKTISKKNIYFPYKEIIETRIDIPTLSIDCNSFLFP
jgi:hypothetical protein